MGDMNSVPIRRDARGRATQLTPAMAANIWKPGQSGNPSGLPERFREVQRLCREASAESVKKLIHLRDHSDDDRVVYMCATWIHEQAWGKAKDYDPTKEKQPSPFNPADFTLEELERIEAVLRLVQARQNAATIDDAGVEDRG